MPTITLHHCQEYLIFGTEPPAGDFTADGTRLEFQSDDALLGKGTITANVHGGLETDPVVDTGTYRVLGLSGMPALGLHYQKEDDPPGPDTITITFNWRSGP